MSEKLIIRNFGGIQELEIDLNRINILIGPQATGKSICAKLLFYFKSFIQDIFSSVENNQSKPELDKLFLKKFEDYFPPHSWGMSSFVARYEINGTFIEITRPEEGINKIKLQYSDFYKKELLRSRNHLKKLLEESKDKEQYSRYAIFFDSRKDFLRSVVSKIDKVAGFSQIFIPAGRSFFAILQSSIFTFLSSNKTMDPFLTEFGSLYESFKSVQYDMDFVKGKDEKRLKNRIDTLVETILCGRLEQEKDKDYLVHSDGRRISIANSSSGQQEMLPLAIILGIMPFIRFLGVGNTIYIEEPEAHLFPNAQRSIVELITTIFNVSKTPLQFIITTHSPYILASFNNLIHARMLETKLDQKKKAVLYRIVSRELMLSYDHISAYSLGYGTFTHIKYKDSGLISTNVLDEVSNEIAIQFDKLLDME